MYKNKRKSSENKTKAIFDKVVNYVKKIADNGEYEKFLKFQKNFRNYSFNNLVLIFNQFPDATKVAGKAKWLSLKREIIDGAKKIFIVAPIPRKYEKIVKKIEDGEEIDETEIIEYNAYRYVYVYDISQTVGEPIPLESKNIDNNNMLEFYEKLKAFSKFPIYERHIEGIAKGYYSPHKKEIVIQKDLSIDDKTAVLLHELSHAMYDDFDYKTDRNLSEIFVESIAYIVADHFGLDTSLCSFNYIAKWANGEPKTVIDLGTKVQKCANDFIKNIENFNAQELKLVA